MRNRLFVLACIVASSSLFAIIEGAARVRRA